MKNKMTNTEKLVKASQSAISSVRKMIQTLKDTNEKVAEERAANDDKIARIQLDNQLLDDLKTDNEKIISNFEVVEEITVAIKIVKQLVPTFFRNVYNTVL